MRHLQIRNMFFVVVGLFCSIVVGFSEPFEDVDEYIDYVEPFCVDKETAVAEYADYGKGSMYKDANERLYNLSKGSLEALLDSLANPERWQAEGHVLAYRYSVRGFLHTVSGKSFRAIGDFLTAKRYCDTIPVEGWIAINYYHQGLENEAFSWVKRARCSRKFEQYYRECTGKYTLLVLLGEHQELKSQETEYLESDLLLQLVSKLLQKAPNAEIEEVLKEINGSQDEEQKETGIELAFANRLEELEKYIFNEYKTYDVLSYLNMYFAVRMFAEDEIDTGCQHARKALELREENRNIFYIYLITRKLNSVYCEPQQ